MKGIFVHELKISAVYDLHVPGKRVDLRAELLAKLQDENTSRYSFEHGGATVYPIMGGLVRVAFSRHGMSHMDAQIAFEGIHIVKAQIEESGSDHFPEAGLYDAATLPGEGIDSATATVRRMLDHNYALSQDVMEAAVRNVSSSSFADTIRLEVPVVYHRSWSLTLTASTLTEAWTAYELLRGGTWTPKTTFIDTLPDAKKLRFLREAVEDQE